MRVMGYWTKYNGRCKFCGRPREKMYMVREGVHKGLYCSRNHYELATKKDDNKRESGLD